MKKRFLLLIMLIVCGGRAFAEGTDSVWLFRLDEIAVDATRAGERTPVTHTNVGKEELSRRNTGVDMPFLLQGTPSVVATSDAGAGVGYTGIRIRGTDATRINVTANGVPLNDAESHGAFWVNIPDIASSVEDVQVQRGVGTSTSGAGAFGGSINMRTEPLSVEPSAEVAGSYGSYNTHRVTGKLNTGLIGDRWIFSGRISSIGSDGYIDRASAKMSSYMAQGGYFRGGTMVRFLTFGGREKTYHAWNGIDAAQLAGNRRYNPCGEILRVVRDADGRPVRDSDGNVATELAGFYKNQIDRYDQHNYQLLFSQTLSAQWNLHVTLHYTDGYGYYEEYKNARTLTEYGLTPFTPADPNLEAWLGSDGKVTKSNLVRRKLMRNDFGGGLFSLNYRSERLALTLGGGFNRYDGDHYGRVIWIENYVGDLDLLHEYYRNHSVKDDANVYLKANYSLTDALNFYADLQYRHIDWTIRGPGDNWDWTWNNYEGRMQELNVDKRYDFFNPKAGLFWQIGIHSSAYGSFGVAHKEPTRNNFTDGKFDSSPRPERLFDYELGYAYRSKAFSFGLNLYYMNYKDQLVLTGETNDIGEALADNVDKSYRLGAEFTAGVRIAEWLRWDGNLTLSRNRIREYTEYLDDVDADYNSLGTQTANYRGSTPIAFSPSVIAGSTLTAEHEGWRASVRTGYVGRQYLTNSRRRDTSLDAYAVTDLQLGYTFALRGVRSVTVGFSVNNLFDERYCSNGWGGSMNVIADDGSTSRYDYAGFFPQATTNVMASISIKF